MPLAIIIIAIVLIAAGIRGSYKDLATLLTGDFTGDGNFLNWLAAIAIVGALGYIPQLQKFSRMFLGLILVSVFLKNGSGVFDQLVSAIQGSSADTQHVNPGNPSGGSSGGTGGDLMSQLTNGITNALGIPSGSQINNAIQGAMKSAPSTPLPATNPGAAASGNAATSIIPDITSGGFMGP